ncbi:MAG: guanylate kinase, partial [Rhizobiales bacterium]|nr:guanylate kinase [Hyphomicrobiales bacterium]
RKMRPGEVDGTDYHFITQERFDEMRDNADLLESATVFGNGYGTPRQPVDDCLAQGKDVLFDIDWQGTQQIVDKLPNDLVRVFILPPSAEELRERLIRRAQDPLSVVAGRMAEASKEISHYAEYDYVLINDDLERCFEELQSILRAERLKRHRRAGLSDFVNAMQEKL